MSVCRIFRIHREISVPDKLETVESLRVHQAGLHERIGKLGLVDRAIVMLWLEDLSYDEIGAIVGITPQNVGVKLFRIKEQLKKM